MASGGVCGPPSRALLEPRPRTESRAALDDAEATSGSASFAVGGVGDVTCGVTGRLDVRCAESSELVVTSRNRDDSSTELLRRPRPGVFELTLELVRARVNDGRRLPGPASTVTSALPPSSDVASALSLVVLPAVRIRAGVGSAEGTDGCFALAVTTGRTADCAPRLRTHGPFVHAVEPLTWGGWGWRMELGWRRLNGRRRGSDRGWKRRLSRRHSPEQRLFGAGGRVVDGVERLSGGGGGGAHPPSARGQGRLHAIEVLVSARALAVRRRARVGRRWREWYVTYGG